MTEEYEAMRQAYEAADIRYPSNQPVNDARDWSLWQMAWQAAIASRDAEIEALREALENIAAQHSGIVDSRALADCMASIAKLALRRPT